MWEKPSPESGFDWGTAQTMHRLQGVPSSAQTRLGSPRSPVWVAGTRVCEQSGPLSRQSQREATRLIPSPETLG